MRSVCNSVLCLLQNDIWQAQSWSSIEYGGRWKLLHYSAKNFFAPLLVSPFQENDIISVYVSSDLMRSVTGKLQVDVWTWMVREGLLSMVCVGVSNVIVDLCCSLPGCFYICLSCLNVLLNTHTVVIF